MLVRRASFTKTWDLIKSFDVTSGAFLLWDPKGKKTFKERIFETTVPRHLFVFTFLIISTLIVTNFQLISVILCSSIASPIIGLIISMFIYMSQKDIVKNLLKWCKSLYDVEEKFHKLFHTVAETKLMELESKSNKYLKWLRILLYVDGLGCTVGLAIIGSLLPETIYPKFSLTLPLYLPFKNQKTWISFWSTTLLETFFAIDTSSIAIFLCGIGITIFIHILGFLDIIQQVVEKMKQEIVANTRQIESTAKALKQPTLSLNTLATINADLMQSQNDKFSFDEWIKVLNEMICDVNSIIVTTGQLYAFPFLLNELAGLGSLFVCGLLLTVEREQYVFAIGITFVCLWLFVICFMNEQILEKFENINHALYDIPWYNLTVDQQKSLMVLMHCDKIQKGLTAARIHNVTLERFGIIVKAGYTNFLVLKDLVQK